MNKISNYKKYDLDERTYKFASNCRDLAGKIPKTLANIEYSKQLIRSSGSVASNYIEANEALGLKDFTYRIKICRKESKESRLWIKLLEIETKDLKDIQLSLIQESIELTKIFSTIAGKMQKDK